MASLPTSRSRCAAALFRRCMKEGRDVDVWTELRGGILLGGDEFVAEIKPLLADYEAARELPRRERHAARPSLAELFADVLDRETRNRQIHAAVRIHEYRLQAVADFLGLSPSTISMVAARIAGHGSEE